MTWYYADGGKRTGPLDEAQFNELVDKGTILSETLVWNEDLPKWMPYGDIGIGGPLYAPTSPSSDGNPPAAKTGICKECGGIFPRDDLLSFGNTLICANCKPVYIQKIKEGAAIPGTMKYGGFWIRFGAKMIDGIILMLISFVFSGISSTIIATGQPDAMSITAAIVVQIIQLIVYFGYSIFFIGKYAATPGKMACGLTVVTSDGDKVSYGRATGRVFAEFISAIILYIGYIMAAFDTEKRSLHDRICDTRVVKKQ